MVTISFIKKLLFMVALIVTCGTLHVYFSNYHDKSLKIRQGYIQERQTIESLKKVSQTKKRIVIKKISQEARKRQVSPEENLPLRLRGIYEYENRKVAYIEDMSNSFTGEFKVGDKVKGARLTQILPGRVILTKNGRSITLTLKSSYNWRESDDWIEAVSGDDYVVGRNRLSRKIKSVGELLKEATPVPYVLEGKIEGFRLASVKRNGIMQEAGFRDGDIIKSVNGCVLDDLKKPIETYKTLRQLVRKEEEPKVEVVFERDSSTRTYTYRILED